MNVRAAVARTAAVALGAAALVAALTGGCERDVVLGGGGALTTTTSATGQAVCAAKACGQACIIDPCEGRSACALADIAGYCDADGRCSADEPMCTPYVACPETSMCGDPCWPCELGRNDCNPQPGTYTCTESKNCLPGMATCDCVGDCPPPNPCANAECGDPCACDPSTDSDCDPDSTSPTFCDASHRCLPVEAVFCPQGYKPCENKNCGESCSPCKGGACASDAGADDAFVCDAYGRCTVAPYTCFKPCTPGSCGERCQPCVETTPGCMIPDNAFCDRFGSCQVADQPGYCPCQGHACGDSCSFCDPMDLTHCTAQEALANVCDETGACVEGAGGNGTTTTCPAP